MSTLKVKQEALEVSGVSIPTRLVLTFYSHTQRSRVDREQDEVLGIDRTCFSNLFELAEPITVPQADVVGLDGTEMKLFKFDTLGESPVGSTEAIFQAAKCALECDALFTAGLSGLVSARYGQARMVVTDEQKEDLISRGADPEDFVADTDRGVAGWRRNKSAWKGRIGNVERRPEWDAVKPSVMMAGLRQKFAAGTTLGKYIETLSKVEGGVMMCEHTTKDVVWADGKDGSGTNYLGKLLTQLVHEHRTGTELPIDAKFLTTPNREFVDYEAPAAAEEAKSDYTPPPVSEADMKRAPAWWHAVDVPAGKLKKLPVDSIDLSDDATWQVTSFRRGKGGKLNIAVMLDTGADTHMTFAFIKFAPVDKRPEDAVAAARAFVASKGVTVVPVLESMPGMYGKNSALVDVKSPLGKLALELHDHLESLDEGWRVDRDRKPHIEIMKKDPDAPRGSSGRRGGAYYREKYGRKGKKAAADAAAATASASGAGAGSA